MSSDNLERTEALDALECGEDKECSQSLTTVDIIKLNVGGTKFYTTRSTLLKSGYFRALLSGKFADSTQADGYLFIDRDPVIFDFVLKYLRCDYVSLPTKYLQEMDLESKFLQIDLDLSSHLEMDKLQHVTITYVEWPNSDSSTKKVKVNGVTMDSRDWVRDKEIIDMWNHFEVPKDAKYRLSHSPIEFAAHLSGKGYHAVSSTANISHASQYSDAFVCVISMEKKIPDHVVLTKLTKSNSSD